MNTRRWLITLVACVLLFAGLAVYKTLQIKALIAYGESFPEPSATVEAVTVTSRPVHTQTSTLGTVVIPQYLELRNELEGRVASINMPSGGRVEQDQTLLQLDISEEQARLKAAEARLTLAKLDLNRVSKLRKNSTVSEERLDQATAQYNIANADISALKATIKKKTLRAPFTALVGLHNVEVGELVARNSLITTLVGINDFAWVDFHLSMEHASLPVGTRVTVSPPNNPEGALQGRIVAKNPTANKTSRNLMFRAKINHQDDLPHNTAVNIAVITENKDSALAIPATAIRHDGLGNYVYVLIKDPHQDVDNAYRAQRQTITLSKTFTTTEDLNSNEPQFVIVSSGLQEGQLIAARGGFKLRDGLLAFTKKRPTINPTH